MAQRIPAHQPDAVLIQRSAQPGLGEIGVRLHLNELRRDLPFALQLSYIFTLEVGDADGFSLALPVGLFQLTIAGQPVSCGLVDIEQIHIVHAQALQRLVHGVGILVLAGPELGGQEHLPAGKAALPDPAAHSPLIDVGVGRVHQRASHLQRFFHTVLRIRGAEHKGADAHHRAIDAVVQRDIFHVFLLNT